MISNEPCLKYHKKTSSECRCLQILNTDIDLFESASKSLFYYCQLTVESKKW